MTDDEPGVRRRTVEWAGDAVVLIDQTALPAVIRHVRCETVERVARAISTLEVRGAPAIGITGAMGIALAAVSSTSTAVEELLAELGEAAARLVATRPTAVNLSWAVDRTVEAAQLAAPSGRAAAVEAAVATATMLADDDVERCHAIGRHGGPLLAGVDQVITHCNAGALATVDYGTALGVIRSAAEHNAGLHVWVDETRPVLQGARLTAYELTRDGIANTVIADSAAASLIARGAIGGAVVGADRIAANGDVANKIGTYGLALACHHHGVPFYVAAPLSTVDLGTPDGASIEIEERSPSELTDAAGVRAYNPAFDVTPADLITAIITEAGVLRAPYSDALARTAR